MLLLKLHIVMVHSRCFRKTIMCFSDLVDKWEYEWFFDMNLEKCKGETLRYKVLLFFVIEKNFLVLLKTLFGKEFLFSRKDIKTAPAQHVAFSDRKIVALYLRQQHLYSTNSLPTIKIHLVSLKIIQRLSSKGRSYCLPRRLEANCL